MAFDLQNVRALFPILSQNIWGKPLAYLDNAATMQMPECVLDVICEQHRLYEANVHRGIHYLSEKSTARLERSRGVIQRFLGANSPEEIIFTSGTTDSINIAAQSLSYGFIRPGDEVLTTEMEHHSNFVTWQQAAKRAGAVFRVLPMNDRGELCIDRLGEYITDKTRVVAVGAVSNVLGTVNPVKEIIEASHRVGAIVLVDGAQAVQHEKIDVKELGCDLFVFSGHKICGPTGTGVLYGRREVLEMMPPCRFGGGMVDTVELQETSFGELPFKFEAGTPNIAGDIALGAAIEFFESLGDEAKQYSAKLADYAVERLSAIEGVKLLGSPSRRAGVVSFNLDGAGYYDVAALLDKLGIAVRSGHHCAQPLLRHFGLTGAVRVSPAFYNTEEEIDRLADGVERIRNVVSKARGGVK